MRYGIPEFKMEKRVLDRRLDQLRAEGVEFKTGVHVGENYSSEELLRNFDAIGLAVGAERPRDLAIPGRELEGIHSAMEFLTQQNRMNQGDAIPSAERIDARGKHVVILGGGDTGSDCLGTAHRQGCAEVHQFEILPEPPQSRSPSTPWPLWPMQLRSSHAHEEGGKRDWSVSTTEFLGRDGRVTGLRAQRVAVEGGRFVPVVGSEFELKADLVLLAMGFTGALIQPLVDALKLETNTKGTVRVGSEFMTSRRGVFASGDARLGASLIVWAIADGRKMAASIDEFLRSN